MATDSPSYCKCLPKAPTRRVPHVVQSVIDDMDPSPFPSPKRGPGRPSAGAAKRRNQVAAYLTDDELSQLDALVGGQSTRSEWLGALIRTFLGREDA